MREACGVSNTRSRLTTGIPACCACRATAVSCLPSYGSMTMTSTFLAIRVWMAAIWAATSLVACTGCRLTSEYLADSVTAFLAMAPVQPWSAAGEEKPIVTVFPGVSLPLVPPLPAAAAAALVVGDDALLDLLLQAVSAAAAPSPVAPNRNPRRARPSRSSDIEISFDLIRFTDMQDGERGPSRAR